MRLELERILDLVEAQGRLAEVLRRAEARRARGRGACPLLSRAGRCSVYEERPLSCRRFHSFDPEACRRVHVTGAAVPSSAALHVAALAVTELVAAGEPADVDLYEALDPLIAARLRRASKRAARARSITTNTGVEEEAHVHA